VQVTITSQSYPVFEKLVYWAEIPEYIARGSAITTLSANSPGGQKLIYTIIDGDHFGDFDIDFNIGKCQGDIDAFVSQLLWYLCFVIMLFVLCFEEKMFLYYASILWMISS